MSRDHVPPLTARYDLASLPLSGRSEKLRNKIQPRSLSADGERSSGSRTPPRVAEGRQEDLFGDARDRRLLRELSRDIKDQLCQSVRAAVREELQSVLHPHLGAPGGPAVGASYQPKAGAAHKLHRTSTIKEITRRNNLATSSSDEAGKVDSMVHSTSMDSMTSVKTMAEPLERIFPPGRFLFDPLYRCASWLDSVEEPERTGFMARLSDSMLFEIFSVVGIALNCAFMVAAQDWAVRHYWLTDTPYTFEAIETMFLIWFGIELGLRMYVHGRYFYLSPFWKIRALDTILMIFQIWSVIGNYGVISTQHNLSFFRAVKMLRVMRVVRALKAMHHFKQLHAMLHAIQTSLLTLLWSMIMVAAILWMFSLLFVQVTIAYFQDLSEGMGMQPLSNDLLSDNEVLLLENFGSVGETMICLLMASTGGNDWSTYYNALSPTGLTAQLAFLMFIALMQFAVLNIVTGIFVETAISQMAHDPNDAAVESLKKQKQQEQDLLAVCREIDANNNGNLNRQEFFEAIRAGKLTGFLDSLGFRPHDLIDFFGILEHASPNNKVDVNVFVSGCMEMSGGATRFGVKATLMELQAVHDAVAELQLGLLWAQGANATPRFDAPVLEPV